MNAEISIKHGTKDKNLIAILEQSAQAAQMLLDAIKPGMMSMRFMAFQIMRLSSPEQTEILIDTIGAAVVMNIGKLDKEIVKIWDFTMNTVTTESGDFEIWFTVAPLEELPEADCQELTPA